VYKVSATAQTEKVILQSVINTNWDGALSKPYSGKSMEIFTTSGTFIVPYGVSSVYLTGCAAGGNGGAGDNDGTFRGGGGGGSGEIIYKKIVTVTAGTSIIVTIGAVGINTSFGATSLNYGANGQSGATGGSGGAGGALAFGTVAGVSGGNHNTVSTSSFIAPSGDFAKGGYSGVAANASATAGGGGAGGLGIFASYFTNSSGLSATTTGGARGEFLGGGGGGGYGNAVNGGNGGNGGYGSGGGGGGGNNSTGTGGAGGAGGPAILIVEW
jgi:hypothetical protein